MKKYLICFFSTLSLYGATDGLRISDYSNTNRLANTNRFIIADKERGTNYNITYLQLNNQLATNILNSALATNNITAIVNLANADKLNTTNGIARVTLTVNGQLISTNFLFNSTNLQTTLSNLQVQITSAIINPTNGLGKVNITNGYALNLTNLGAPTVTDLSNEQHGHTNVISGGQLDASAVVSGVFNVNRLTSRVINVNPPLVILNAAGIPTNTLIEIPKADGITSGYLSSNDWVGFSLKQNGFITGTGITNNGNVLSNNIVAGTAVTIVAGANGQLTINSLPTGSGAPVGTVINTASTVAGQLAIFSDNQKTNLAPISIGLGLTNSSGVLSNNIIAGINTTITSDTNGQLTITANQATYSDQTIVGNISGSPTIPTGLTPDQVRTLLGLSYGTNYLPITNGFGYGLSTTNFTNNGVNLQTTLDAKALQSNLTIVSNNLNTNRYSYDPKKLVLLAFGDSLTETGYNGQTCWFSQLITNYPWNLSYQTNFGHAGDTMAQITNTLGIQLPNFPLTGGSNGIVFLWGGANNYDYSGTVTYIAGISNIVNLVHSYGYQIALFNVLSRTGYGLTYEPSRAFINNRLYRLSNVDYWVDVAHTLTNPNDETFFLSDGIHLRSNGHNIVSKLVAYAISSGPRNVIPQNINVSEFIDTTSIIDGDGVNLLVVSSTNAIANSFTSSSNATFNIASRQILSGDLTTNGQQSFSRSVWGFDGVTPTPLSTITVATNNYWTVIFHGSWENNQEGSGLVDLPPYVECNTASPTFFVGSFISLTVSNSAGQLVGITTSGGSSKKVAFFGTVEIYVSNVAQATKSISVPNDIVTLTAVTSETANMSALNVSSNTSLKVKSRSVPGFSAHLNQAFLRSVWLFNSTSNTPLGDATINLTTPWTAILEGTWLNNTQGAGLVDLASYLECNAASPTITVGNLTLTLSRNSSSGLLQAISSSGSITFAGTIKIIAPLDVASTNSIKVLGNVVTSGQFIGNATTSTVATNIANNQGTTTTALLGNASGAPSFGKVNAAIVTGLGITNNGAVLSNNIVAGSNVTITSGANGQLTVAASAPGSGTVTSVAASVPSLFSISGSPITTSGTLAMTYSGTALPVLNGGTGFTDRTLRDSAGTPKVSLDWDNRLLEDNVAGFSIDYGRRLTVDTNGTSSMNWDTRKLFNSSGQTVLDWSGNLTGLGLTNRGSTLSNNIIAGAGISIISGGSGQLTIGTSGLFLELFSITNDTLINTTVESSLIGAGIGSTTISANTAILGHKYHVTIGGYYSSAAVSPGNVTFNAYYGTTVIATSSAIAFVAGGGSNKAFRAEFDMTFRSLGASAGVVCNGAVNLATTTFTDEIIPLVNPAAPVTVDTTSAKVIDFTVTIGTGAIGNSFTSQVGNIQ